MKQSITSKQIGELSEKAQNDLASWMAKHIEVNDINGVLNIGQMIEFLHEHSNEMAIGFNDSGVFWHVHIGERGTGDMLKGFGKIYDSNEDDKDLCDALWAAVKEILEAK